MDKKPSTLSRSDTKIITVNIKSDKLEKVEKLAKLNNCSRNKMMLDIIDFAIANLKND